MGIIFTGADTDLYKLTMSNCVNRNYERALVTYALRVRSKVEWTQTDVNNIKREIAGMGNLTFSQKELDYLGKRCTYLPRHYLTFLKGFRLQPDNVNVWLENGELRVEAKGLWSEEIFWETMLMAIISECYFEDRAPLTDLQLEEAYENAKAKAKKFRELAAYFIEMGTRRRRSYAVQKAVIEGLRDGGGEFFLGTSNVHFAAEYGLTAYGSIAHEMFSAVAAMYGVENANNIVLGKWADTYSGLLGTVLPDTFTTDFFLRTFDSFYAHLFPSIRHDSGCPLTWTDKIVAHYKKLGIDSRPKKAVYSDGISSFDTVKNIGQAVDGRMMHSFGIGTWLTNDFADLPALNMVFKLVTAQKNPLEPSRHAVKLSDVPGKYNGDEDTIKDYLKRIAV